MSHCGPMLAAKKGPRNGFGKLPCHGASAVALRVGQRRQRPSYSRQPFATARRPTPAGPFLRRIAVFRRVLGRNAGAFGRSREVAALVVWTLAAFLALALVSYRGDPAGAVASTPPGGNWVGPVGELCARGLVSLLGLVACALPLELFLLGIPLVRGKESAATPGRIAGDLLSAVVAAALIQVGGPSRTAFGTHTAGGVVGELFGELARSLFSTAGSFLVGFACLGLILIGRAAFSFIALARLLARVAARLGRWFAEAGRALAEAWTEARSLERDRKAAERAASEPRIDASRKDEAIIAALPMDEDEGLLQALAEEPPPRRSRKTEPIRATDSAPPSPDPAPAPAPDEAPHLPSPPPPAPTFAPTADTGAPEAPEKKRRPRKAPAIVDTSAALEKERGNARGGAAREPCVLLRASEHRLARGGEGRPGACRRPRQAARQRGEARRDARRTTACEGKVEDILPGPTVTTYEVSPAAGTKVSKVAGLADDLALALARKVRIVAPIPGQEPHRLRAAQRAARPGRAARPHRGPPLPGARRRRCPSCSGATSSGNPVYADLASMPHVIVAGATGAGKSVGPQRDAAVAPLPAIARRAAPPHDRSEGRRARAVRSHPAHAAAGRDRHEAGGDRAQVGRRRDGAALPALRRRRAPRTSPPTTAGSSASRAARRRTRTPEVVLAKDHNGFTDAIPAEKGSDEGEAPLPEKLPWIVIVVDEFADLMMQQGKEVEAAVARLAQKARAAGMHVILATQRPSVDVITGIIKANFPTRIAYRVSQKVDSRTILDEQGAEHLLGRGDMLIKLNGTNDTKRVQCPWVSEEEVQRVTDFLRTQGEPVYDDNILRPRDDEEAEDDDDAEQDPMYDDAVRLVADTRRCSTSWLQRKLQLGYNRAARIVEMMERRGLVGPANGAKDREVLVDPI